MQYNAGSNVAAKHLFAWDRFFAMCCTILENNRESMVMVEDDDACMGGSLWVLSWTSLVTYYVFNITLKLYANLLRWWHSYIFLSVQDAVAKRGWMLVQTCLEIV